MTLHQPTDASENIWKDVREIHQNVPKHLHQLKIISIIIPTKLPLLLKKMENQREFVLLILIATAKLLQRPNALILKEIIEHVSRPPNKNAEKDASNPVDATEWTAKMQEIPVAMKMLKLHVQLNSHPLKKQEEPVFKRKLQIA